MPTPAEMVVTTQFTGMKEEVGDFIYDVDPHETPFISRTKKIKADKNTLHQWMTDGLRSPQVNKHLEGSRAVYDEHTPHVRLTNEQQIFMNGVSVSGSSTAVENYGMKNALKREVAQKLKEHKLDIEYSMFMNVPKEGRSSVVEGQLAGLPTWIVSNINQASDATAATGDGTDSRADGTALAFSQARFDSVMQNIWDSTGYGGTYTCYLSSYQLSRSLSFVGNNNQRNETRPGRIVSDLVIYITPWGQVRWQPSRHVRPQDVFIIKDDMWKIAQKRPTKNTPMAQTGDSTERMIVTELTLEASNEKASGAVYDNSVV